MVEFDVAAALDDQQASDQAVLDVLGRYVAARVFLGGRGAEQDRWGWSTVFVFLMSA